MSVGKWLIIFAFEIQFLTHGIIELPGILVSGIDGHCDCARRITVTDFFNFLDAVIGQRHVVRFEFPQY